MANSRQKHLTKAKKGKNDEFYTQWSDIEKEVNAYIEYNPNVFRDKTILLPADDPFESNFFKFFATKFNEYGLKKLIATSYAPSPIVNTQLTLLPELVPEKEIEQTRDKQITEAYKIELNEVVDENGTGTVNIDDVITRLLKEKEVIDSGGTSSILSYLKGDNNPDGINNFSAGDFRSQEVSKLRKEADIIITNPPFSLFREFLEWIAPNEKQFLIIGNMNAITYKEVFPLIKDNKIWLGTGMGRWISGFIVPDSYELYGTEARIEKGQRIVSTNNALWMTNLDHGKRHQPLSLMTMEENIKYSKHKNIKNIGYMRYDDYDAIEIPYTDAIPSDYEGIMGVPISFLDKFNPAQFEILGLDNPTNKFIGHGPVLKGKTKYRRVFIRAMKR
ncbi:MULTISPECIES: adenine-specific methyltransferase EcoRI family protein [Enterococcus]|uniref:adenine-specific methyltransferase EcoRI family protein n=1 Tax=Enterococcus TaxID=1350 RepID=UPI00065DC533|nr:MULTISPECIES: adenine-specific methyltransferase EcoRI family protein [Enterococcus]HAZ0637589.1 DNA methyltransferase [Enterococcus faecium]HAZ1080078.1 DNA methyltransferase [Enterococcus faecium]HCQ8782899.1 adenine-specific methyltransferase EcoRI family protein [Enterococcus faecium]HCZ8405402.1 adenine-specific methyltransferase EcoRI family protein [Enterococcus faecium]